MEIQTILISGAVIAGVGIFSKLYPREKLAKLVSKPMYQAGKFVSKFLVLRLGKKAADKFEEGILYTITYTLSEGLLSFEKGLKEDNDSKRT